MVLKVSNLKSIFSWNSIFQKMNEILDKILPYEASFYFTFENCKQKDTESIVKNQNLFNKPYYIFLNSTLWDWKLEWKHLVTQHKRFLRLQLESGTILIHSTRTNSCRASTPIWGVTSQVKLPSYPWFFSDGLLYSTCLKIMDIKNLSSSTSGATRILDRGYGQRLNLHSKLFFYIFQNILLFLNCIQKDT